MKILVCDESGDVLHAVQSRQNLEPMAELIIVTHWKSAIEILDKERFDVVIMGMELPFDSSNRILNHIRKVLRVPIPIVVV